MSECSDKKYTAFTEALSDLKASNHHYLDEKKPLNKGINGIGFTHDKFPLYKNMTNTTGAPCRTWSTYRSEASENYPRLLWGVRVL